MGLTCCSAAGQDTDRTGTMLVARPQQQRVGRHLHTGFEAPLRPKDLFAAILVPQFQGAGSSLGLQNKVGVPRACRASETPTRSWLGGGDLD